MKSLNVNEVKQLLGHLYNDKELLEKSSEEKGKEFLGKPESELLDGMAKGLERAIESLERWAEVDEQDRQQIIDAGK